MCGPLLDEDDVFSGQREVGPDRGAVRPGPDDGDPTSGSAQCTNIPPSTLIACPVM